MTRLHDHSLHDSRFMSTSFLWSLLIVIVFSLVLLGFYYSTSTGYVGLELTPDDLVAGQLVSGTLSYDFGDGPLPADTELMLTVNGYQKTISLADVYSGPSEVVTFFPLLKVVVKLEETFTGEATTVQPGGGGGGGSGKSASSGSGAHAASPSEPLATAPIVEYKTYYVRTGEPVSDSIPSNRYVSIEEVRLEGSDELLENSVVSLSREGTSIGLSTSFQEHVVGYAQTSERTEIVIPLESFNFVLSARTMSSASISLVFKHEGNVFAQVSDVVSVRSEVIPVDPELEIEDTPLPPQPDAGSGSSGGIGAVPLFPTTCESPACTSYGLCSIPPLGSKTTSTQLIRTRQCICPDGSSYNEQEVCTLSSETQVQPAGLPDSFEPLDADPPVPPLPDSVAPTTPQGYSSDTSWERTYTFNEREVVVGGGIMQSLGENERIRVPIGDSEHSVGVLRVDRTVSVPRVLVEVASTPQEFYISLGETISVDSNKDSLSDLAVTFVSLTSGNKVLIRVAPLGDSVFSQMLGANDRAVTLLSSNDVPIGHVIVNEELPSLRVFFVQSASSLPAHCFNSITDEGELDVDCGGACNQCRVERGFYLPLYSWIIVFVLFVFLAFLSRSRAA